MLQVNLLVDNISRISYNNDTVNKKVPTVSQIDFTQFSYEELAHALYAKGKADGFIKVTDKTKWRELVVAEKLGHKALPKISSGKNTEGYGSDAVDNITGKKAEYKSKAIEDKELRNLLQLKRGRGEFKPLTIGGVYNGAYSHEAVDAYEKIDHYFGVFYEELCVLIIKVHTPEVIRQLRGELDRRAKLTKNGSTNLNTVKIKLTDTHLYEVAYRNDQWYEQQGQQA